MAWLDENKDWVPKSKQRPKPPKKVEMTYRISEVAEMLSVTHQTVFKWLSIDEPEDAIIPPSAWFRLPGGHIRIFESAVLQLQKQL